MALPAPALMVLEDGRTFRGESFGAEGETFGEAVFSTGMSGYQETLTDPSYHRQVVVMTAPHVGNTGMNDEDTESSRIWVAGYVVRDPARVPSSWRSVRSLDDDLRDQGVVGISGVDTRALTRHLRERGAMRVGISTTETDPQRLLARVLQSGEMTGANLSEAVSTQEAYVVPAVGREALHRRRRRPRHQVQHPADDERARHRGARAPGDLDASTTSGRSAPTGCSSPTGPATPRPPPARCELLQDALRAGIPYFGICFGNQLFGRALGFGTYKLKYGHRGINQPVMDRTTGKVEVTAHNHGFAVDAPLEGSTTTEFGEATVSHVCLNDDVVEGLELRDADGRLTSFSVAVPPRGGRRPARRGVPLRPVRGPDERQEGRLTCPSAPTSRASWSSAPGRSSSARPASSTTPAPRRAGCCARRACGSSWSTPTRPRS